MLTRILNRTKNEIKPTKKWDNEVIKMVERYDARKKIKEVSQRHQANDRENTQGTEEAKA